MCGIRRARGKLASLITSNKTLCRTKAGTRNGNLIFTRRHLGKSIWGKKKKKQTQRKKSGPHNANNNNKSINHLHNFVTIFAMQFLLEKGFFCPVWVFVSLFSLSPSVWFNPTNGACLWVGGRVHFIYIYWPHVGTVVGTVCGHGLMVLYISYRLQGVCSGCVCVWVCVSACPARSTGRFVFHVICSTCEHFSIRCSRCQWRKCANGCRQNPNGSGLKCCTSLVPASNGYMLHTCKHTHTEILDLQCRS